MNIDNLIPDTFYLSGLAALFLIFIYLPIILWVIFYFWKKAKLNRIGKSITAIVFIAIASAIPLWDVYVSSLQMEKLCEAEAGTHIYKTVTINGFLNNRLSEELLEYGYDYIEGKRNGKLYLAKKNDDGSVEVSEINKAKSNYSYSIENEILNNHIKAKRFYIKEISSNSILAERIDFYYYPGWLDRKLFLSWLYYKPPTCSLPKFFSSDFQRSVLIPSDTILKGDK